MDSFYYTVVIIAFVILIVLLICLGIAMSYPNNNESPFPSFNNPCPDYWTFQDKNPNDNSDGSFCVTNLKSNAGILGTSTTPLKKVTSGSSSGSSYISSFFIDVKDNDVCGWSKWANSNKVNWNGFSNSNQC